MRDDRSWPVVFLLLSAGIHAGIGWTSRTLFAAAPLLAPSTQIEVVLEPPPAPEPAPPEKETAAPAQPKPENGTGTGASGKERKGHPSPRRAGGGGSPAPAPLPGGRGGAAGPKTPLEDILYSGGGAGGQRLPRRAPRAGGGGGLSVQITENPRAQTTIPETRSGAGPGTGGGAGTGSDGGLGFAPGAGVGTSPDAAAPPLSTQQSADGLGLGAASGSETGTRPPGGGTGTGSDLPGTGGEGEGYGRGTGDGKGQGNGEGGEGDGGGGGGRGAVFREGSSPEAAVGEAAVVRIVYLVDVSLSMERGNKLAAAQEALKQAVGELKPADAFNIIAFDGEIHPLATDLLPANPENVRRALDYVDALKLGQGTNLGAALDSAFSPETPITQVYVLSDGEPTVGETDKKKLRALAREHNCRHGAQVMTLALGEGERFPGIPLLRDLAQENNGVFRYINLKK